MSTTNYLPFLIAGLYFSPRLITMKLATKGRLKIPTNTTTSYGKGDVIV